MSGKKIVVINFKMNLPSLAESEYWLDNFFRAKKDFSAQKTELVLCPPTIFWEVFSQKTQTEEWMKLGVQNCFWEEKGSFTGEISPLMVKSRGGKYIIVGHSERKNFLREQEEEIGLKLDLVLKTGLKPIFCLGETWQERKNGASWPAVARQLEKGLKNVKKNQLENIVFCYEPVWAISSNQPNRLPTDNEIMEARLLIKKFIKEKYDDISAEKITVIYGGSVDEKNYEKICLSTGMEGALIGKTGLLVYDLLKIIRQNEK